MKKVILLCGYIGSGKTTYAQTHYPVFTDLDYMPLMSRKSDQIRWTYNLLKKHDEVCHITCFPTREEARAFERFTKQFIWIDTSLNQAKTNILIRGRERDMIDLNRVLRANAEYAQKLSGVKPGLFEFIKVFGGGR